MGVVRIAGGIVWRHRPLGVEVALQRSGGGDWILPKGEAETREAWHEAAVRNVAEETGCAARLLSFAGATAYDASPALEIVFYWNMELVSAGSRLDTAWLRPAEAIERLGLAPERRLLARAWARRSLQRLDDAIPVGNRELERARLIVTSALLSA